MPHPAWAVALGKVAFLCLVPCKAEICKQRQAQDHTHFTTRKAAWWGRSMCSRPYCYSSCTEAHSVRQSNNNLTYSSCYPKTASLPCSAIPYALCKSLTYQAAEVSRPNPLQMLGNMACAYELSQRGCSGFDAVASGAWVLMAAVYSLTRATAHNSRHFQAVMPCFLETLAQGLVQASCRHDAFCQWVNDHG